MRKIILVVHTSIDGFVAGEDGGFDGFTQSPENLDFVCSLTDNADALLVGRVSFQMLETYWPDAHNNDKATSSEIKYSKWYNAAEKIVLSKSLIEKRGDVTMIADDIERSITNIKNKKGKDILLFGSPSVYKTLSRLNLIDEYWILMYPALFGKGIPLYGSYDDVKGMRLLECRTLTKGEVVLHYEVESFTDHG